MADHGPSVAIVDYGMGNLFSVAHACCFAGMNGTVTADPDHVDAADAVILPGVGAFGDAMRVLDELGLSAALHRAAADGRPVIGICLGMQLFMTRSFEFGEHAGLNLIGGDVVRLSAATRGAAAREEKVPLVGWERVRRPAGVSWADTPLATIADGAHLYFVHSFCVQPTDASMVLATSMHGGVPYCSAIRRGNVFGCQFHPERSGTVGLEMYCRLARLLGNGGRVAGCA